jgi:hypothetical protein
VTLSRAFAAVAGTLQKLRLWVRAGAPQAPPREVNPSGKLLCLGAAIGKLAGLRLLSLKLSRNVLAYTIVAKGLLSDGLGEGDDRMRCPALRELCLPSLSMNLQDFTMAAQHLVLPSVRVLVGLCGVQDLLWHTLVIVVGPVLDVVEQLSWTLLVDDFSPPERCSVPCITGQDLAAWCLPARGPLQLG